MTELETFSGPTGTVACDETPGQSKAWDGYLEVYTREELTVFQFDLTNHADELRDRLALVKGVLVTDAESRNKAGAPGAVFAHCNAHVVRKPGSTGRWIRLRRERLTTYVRRVCP